MPKKKKAIFEVTRGGLFEEPTYTIPIRREEATVSGSHLRGEKFDDCEFVFQFDNDEPVVFATTSKNSFSRSLTIKIDSTSHGNLTFNHNGRTFKIFAREPKTFNIS